MTPLVIISSFIALTWCIHQRTGRDWSRSILWTTLLTAAIICLVVVTFALLDGAGIINVGS